MYSTTQPNIYVYNTLLITIMSNSTEPPVIMSSSPATSGDFKGNSEFSGVSHSHYNGSGGNGGVVIGKGKNIPLVSQPLQVLTLSIILISAILINGSVILNISKDSLKLLTSHFLFIRHVCIADTIGALLVLPIPLISFIKGYWDWGETACSVISTTTACSWTMHLVAVALYRMDRLSAVFLPTGRYPLVSARLVNGMLLLIWSIALAGSYIATLTFTPTFQPALALCIPNVPLAFFILVFTCYCLALTTMTTGYVIVFIRRRRRRKKEQPQQQKITASSAPELYVTRVQQENRIVVITTNTKTPSSSTYSYSSSSSNPEPQHRPLTPTTDRSERNKTHRRTHSEPLSTPITKQASNDSSMLSVQYKTLQAKISNHSDEEDEITNEAEESVAEKLDECDTGLSNSSNNNHEFYVNNNDVRGGGDDGDRVAVHSHSARCRVISSYAVSIGHLLLYLPAMLVIGLLGASLPPSVAFLCGLVVYCEFIVQPIALLLVSPKLRGEVITMVTGYARSATTRFRNRANSNATRSSNTVDTVSGEQQRDQGDMLNIVVVLGDDGSNTTKSTTTTLPPDQHAS